MKKIVLILMAITFAIGNVNSQVKRTTTKRTTTSVAAKKKAEAEAKAQAEAEAKAKAEAEAKAETEAKAAEENRIYQNNAKCKFSFNGSVFVSNQGYDNYVIYEIPGMTTSELKTSVISAIGTIYSSPKDVINSVSDNLIQLTGITKGFKRTSKIIGESYKTQFIFNLVIQFKDGKVRYNAPVIKYIVSENVNTGKRNINDFSGVNIRNYLLEDDYLADTHLKQIEYDINNLISSINSHLIKSNDW